MARVHGAGGRGDRCRRRASAHRSPHGDGLSTRPRRVSGWRSLAYRLVRPLLFGFDPDRIHRLTVSGLRVAGAHPIGRWLLRAFGGAGRHPPPVELLGIHFRNRVGIGAGFDKDARALRGWAALGLGFAEVGTVTPLAQPGNERPRLFRLPEDDALI